LVTISRIYQINIIGLRPLNAYSRGDVQTQFLSDLGILTQDQLSTLKALGKEINMKEPNSKRLALVIARKLALKFVLVIALLSASVVAHGSAGYFWGYLDNGDTAWLWCGSDGNYWTRCDTGSCPTGESCPCYRCDTPDCQASANFQCSKLIAE